MGAPSINIVFIEKGITAMERGERGVVALVLKDKVKQQVTIYSVSDIPAGLSPDNRELVEMALMGYQKSPKKIILYVMSQDAATLDAEYQEMEKYFESTSFNWLAVPSVETDEKTQELVTWIKAQRCLKRTVKAVLPNTAADTEGVINVASSLFKGNRELEPEKATARVAGLIAGTPMTISCTYAPLKDFTDCTRLSPAELDAAVDAGKFVFLWDGEKVKVCRGVNSFVTSTDVKGDSFKKIKIVEVMDMIQDDIQMTAQDNYIGKYANSYDNKCLLITAINGYFAELIREGIISSGSSEIDIDAQRNYLQSKGIAVESMSDQEIKESNTGSRVFLKATVSILDAIEDIDLNIYI